MNIAIPANLGPLTFPPLSDLTPTMAAGEYARARHCLVGRAAEDGLKSFVTLTQRLVRCQQNGFLHGKDVHAQLWTAADLSGLVELHGTETIQNVMASAIRAAVDDPDDR